MWVSARCSSFITLAPIKAILWRVLTAGGLRRKRRRPSSLGDDGVSVHLQQLRTASFLRRQTARFRGSAGESVVEFLAAAVDTFASAGDFASTCASRPRPRGVSRALWRSTRGGVGGPASRV